jgi:hypothetical protein
MSTPRAEKGPIHFAELVDREGDVRVACASKFDPRRQRWTMIRNHVTCSECRAILRERPVRPRQRRMSNGLPACKVVRAELLKRGSTVVSHWRLELECGHTLPCHRAQPRAEFMAGYQPRFAGCHECAATEVRHAK